MAKPFEDDAGPARMCLMHVGLELQLHHLYYQPQILRILNHISKYNKYTTFLASVFLIPFDIDLGRIVFLH